MGSRLWKVALVAVAVLSAAACAPMAQPLPPLRVTTEADTFDGICDELDCSFRDAVHVSNTRAPHPNGLPNEIRVPAGTYAFTSESPIEFTRPVVVNGVGRLFTHFDLTDSPITAPGGVIDPKVAVVITGVKIFSDTETPTHVFASCAGHLPKPFSLINSATVNLAATSASCDAGLVGVNVIGPAAVLNPNSISAVGSRLPFQPVPLEVIRFSFVNSVVTGPTNEDGSSLESELIIHPLPGFNINGTFTGTHFDRVGLTVGDPDGGNVFAAAISSSFDLDAESGPKRLEVTPGSSLRLTQSSVFGGGPGGAVISNGGTVLQGATIANDGPAVVVGDGVTVTSRRSILSSFGGPVCTAPITLNAHNVLVGTSCGTPSATDLVVASHEDLHLS
jgi:hypothetical protein